MMKSRNSLTVTQLNDSPDYFDLYPETFWQGGKQSIVLRGGYARVSALLKQIRTANPERTTELHVRRFTGADKLYHLIPADVG